MISSGQADASAHAPVSVDLLDRIRHGGSTSEFIKRKHRQLLKDQGPDLTAALRSMKKPPCSAQARGSCPSGPGTGSTPNRTLGTIRAASTTGQRSRGGSVGPMRGRRVGSVAGDLCLRIHHRRISLGNPANRRQPDVSGIVRGTHSRTAS